MRATELGDALITEGTEKSDAELTLLDLEDEDAQPAVDAAYEVAVTTTIVAATAGRAAAGNLPALVGTSAASRIYNIAAAQHQQALRDKLNAAVVGLAAALKSVNVDRAKDIAKAEGVYQSALAHLEADAAADAAELAEAPSVSELGFAAAYAAARAQWIDAMGLATNSGQTPAPFTIYAGAMAAADADELIALAQALADADELRGAADVAHAQAVEPLKEARINTQTSRMRQYAEGRMAQWNARKFKEATANRSLDTSFATAERTNAVAYATANKTYWIGLLGLGPEESTEEIVQTRDLGFADGILSAAIGRGNGRSAWGTDYFVAEQDDRTDDGNARRDLDIYLSDTNRDFAVAVAPLSEIQALAYASAQTSYWDDLTTAQNARRMAESNAVANLRTAGFQQSAVAWAAIDSELEITWTHYASTVAAAKSDWWEQAERDNFLGLAIATNSAEADYTADIILAFSSWASQTTAHKKAFDIANANDDYEYLAARSTTLASTIASVAMADADWYAADALADRNDSIAVATNYRDWMEQRDEQAYSQAEYARLTQRSSKNASNDRAYDAALVKADFDRWLANSNARRTRSDQHFVAAVPYVTAIALADEQFAIARANAEYERVANIGAAAADSADATAESIAELLADLALSEPTPWINYDAAVASADAVFALAVDPAQRDFLIAQADAQRDYDSGVASAGRSLVCDLIAKQASFADTTTDAEYTAIATERTAALAAPGFFTGTRSNDNWQPPAPVPVTQRLAFARANGEPESGEASSEPPKDTASGAWWWWARWNAGGGKVTLDEILIAYRAIYGESDPFLRAFVERGYQFALGDVWGNFALYKYEERPWQIWIEEDLANPFEAAALLRQALLKAAASDRNIEGRIIALNGTAHEPDSFQQLLHVRLDEAKALLNELKGYGEVAISIANEGADLAITFNELSEGNLWAALGLLPLIPGAAFREAGKTVFRFVRGDEVIELSTEFLSKLVKSGVDEKAVKNALEAGVPPSVIDNLLTTGKIKSADELSAFAKKAKGITEEFDSIRAKVKDALEDAVSNMRGDRVLGAKKLTTEQFERLQAKLAEGGVDLQSAQRIDFTKQIGQGVQDIFDFLPSPTGRHRMTLAPDPTLYEVYHELAHFYHWLDLLKEARLHNMQNNLNWTPLQIANQTFNRWLAIGKRGREKWVYEWMHRQKFWTKLTEAERLDAQRQWLRTPNAHGLYAD